jgi:predicted MPP superfamily phosphohydrolase
MKYRKLILAMTLGIVILAFCLWQNNDIVVNEYLYKTKEISDRFDGFSIAHISDLHNKEFGKNQKHLIRILDKAAPNLIAITGDIVDSKKTNVDVALEFVKGATQIAPVYYVTGNHEYWLSQNDYDKLMQGMREHGVIILDNKVTQITAEGEAGFYLLGLSDNNLTDQTLETLCSDTNSGQLQILLAHEPQYLDLYSSSSVDLVLSGHAHGGQFRLPGLGGLVAPGQGFLPKYTSGAYVEGNTTMIVSRGLGNSIIPVRIFNRPQVVIIKLKKV